MDLIYLILGTRIGSLKHIKNPGPMYTLKKAILSLVYWTKLTPSMHKDLLGIWVTKSHWHIHMPTLSI